MSPSAEATARRTKLVSSATRCSRTCAAGSITKEAARSATLKLRRRISTGNARVGFRLTERDAVKDTCKARKKGARRIAGERNRQTTPVTNAEKRGKPSWPRSRMSRNAGDRKRLNSHVSVVAKSGTRYRHATSTSKR